MKHKLIFTVFSILFLIPVYYPSNSFGASSRLDRLEAEIMNLKEENEALKERIETLEEARKEGELAEKDDEVDTAQTGALAESSIEERMELIESEAKETTESFLAGLVNLSGYADVEYRQTDEEGVGSGFRIHHLSLFVRKDIDKKWKLFSEIEFEDAPLIQSSNTTDTTTRSQGRIVVEQMYVEYKHSLDLDFRFGRFITPAGYWNIYHYKPYVVTQSRPMMVDKLFPKFSDGIQLRKTFPVAGSQLDSHFYLVNGSGNPGRMDRNNNIAVGARVNYRADVLNGIDAGVSFFNEKDNASVRKGTYGVYMKVNVKELEFLSEYATRSNDLDGLKDFNDISLYAQVKFDLGKKWIVAARYDWYDPNDSLPDADIYRYTGAVNYRLARNVIGKFEYSRNEFDSSARRDYNEFIASIVIAIGDI